jgi:Stress responsive A/B Barrel Domain
MNRRTFVSNTLIASTLTATASANILDKTGGKKFVHHVFFWLKNPENEADRQKLIAALKALKKIPTIKFAHVGLPIVTEFDKGATDGSYSVSVMLLFDNAKDEETYLYHPLHKKFIDENKDLWNKVMVYDSLAQ